MATGVVKWFNAAKGYYGFNAQDEGPDVFAHFSGISGSGYREPRGGGQVTFRIVPGRKGPQAEDIVRR